MQEEYVVSPRDVAAWVSERAIPGHTRQVEVDKGYWEDMESLRNMVGNARLVALGESTYGSHDVFLLKQHLLKFLIERMDFTLFALPESWAGICALNKYVHEGSGDPSAMINNLYHWRWMTQEMLDLLGWLRAHNARCAPDLRVSFVGLDCLGYVPTAMDQVLDYLEETDPDWAVVVGDLYASFRSYDNDASRYANLKRAVRKQCRAQLQQVYDGLIARRPLLTRLSSEDEFLQVLQNATVVLQAEEIYAEAYADQQQTLRQRFMADNVEWLLENYRPQARMLLWTHNGEASLLSRDQQATTLSAYISERYQNELLTIGCGFHHGAFYAQDAQQPGTLHEYQAEDVPDDSFEAIFALTGLPAFWLDIRELELDDARARWFTKPHFTRYVRNRYVEREAWQPMHLLRSFDVFAFVHYSGPATLLPQVWDEGFPLPAQPVNLDFRHGRDDWAYKGSPDHEVIPNSTDDVNMCLHATNAETQEFCYLEQRFQAQRYLGQRIILSAEMMTQDVLIDASIWLRAISASDKLLKRAVVKVAGSQGWQVCEAELDVPPDSYALSLCIALRGPGTAWFADLQLEMLAEEI